jgi:hypothetical protein
LDFLGDHPRQSYSTEELKDNLSLLLHVNITIPKDCILNAIDELVELNMVKIVETKYQLNTDNEIVKAVLRYGFEEAKKESDRLAAEGN